ncbi:MAG: aminopeptidase, partial [Bacteroidia bacterium]
MKLMRKNYSILFLVLISFNLSAQDSLYTRKVINTLCSKQFAGRGYVKNGLDIAAKFIVEELKKSKVNPLFSTGFYQWFDMNVNTFPGKMDVSINGKALQPGIDFIVSEESTGLKGKFETEKKDSVTYLAKNTELPLAITLNKKLTFSVSTQTANYCVIQLLNNNTYNNIKTVEVNIENKVLTKYLCKNICAYIKGKDVKNDTVIMFTAHYDHLGMMGSKTYFPGAN